MASNEPESEGSTVIEMENLNGPLLASVRQMLDELPPISPGYCIYKAPLSVRQLNEKAYTPQKVSIGPLHHGDKHLLPMEEQKLRYLRAFLDRTKLSLEDCEGFIRQQEQRVRDCYVESIKLRSDDFVNVILVDSCFIIEVIWRFSYLMGSEVQEVRDEADYLSNPISLVEGVRRDMILLENQIPFFTIAGLFDLAFPHPEHPFAQLSVGYFAVISLLGINDFPQEKYSSLGQKAKHFVDLLRLCHLPSARTSRLPKNVLFTTTPTARELKEVGMSIRKGSSKNLLEIRYANGVLEIPEFFIHENSEIALRNLIAFEMCHCIRDSYIIDYAMFMDALVDTADDVDILVQNGVLKHSLLDPASITDYFNNLAADVLWSSQWYYYEDLSLDVNEYCKVASHRWKAILKRDYFSTPWRILATCVAAILLLLTFVQTLCSILQTWKK